MRLRRYAGSAALDGLARSFEAEFPLSIEESMRQVPQLRATRVAAQSIPHATWTAVVFDTVAYERGAPETQLSGGNFLCGASGLYVISFVVGVTGSVAGNHRIGSVTRNGIPGVGEQLVDKRETSNGQFSAGAFQAINGVAHVRLDRGDVCQLNAYQDSGGALGIAATGSNPNPHCWMAWEWVCA